jgi:hypothetical protein
MLVDVAEQRPLTISSALIDGIPVNTVPVLASSASDSLRTAAAAAAAPFRWSAIVSAAVVFFQSASLSFSRTAVAYSALASNCLANASLFVPMVSSLVGTGTHSPSWAAAHRSLVAVR